MLASTTLQKSPTSSPADSTITVLADCAVTVTCTNFLCWTVCSLHVDDRGDVKFNATGIGLLLHGEQIVTWWSLEGNEANILTGTTMLEKGAVSSTTMSKLLVSGSSGLYCIRRPLDAVSLITEFCNFICSNGWIFGAQSDLLVRPRNFLSWLSIASVVRNLRANHRHLCLASSWVLPAWPLSKAGDLNWARLVVNFGRAGRFDLSIIYRLLSPPCSVLSRSFLVLVLKAESFTYKVEEWQVFI